MLYLRNIFELIIDSFYYRTFSDKPEF